MKDADRKAMIKVRNAAAETVLKPARERRALLAKLRQRYAELEPLKFGMSEENLERFEEIGDLIDLLEKAEEGGARAH